MRKKVKIVFLHSSRYTVYWRRRRKPFGDWGSRGPGSSARMFFIRRVSIKIWRILRDRTQCRWILGFLICWSEFKIYLTADSNFYIYIHTYIYTYLYLLTQLLDKNPGEPGAKKNSKKEKAKNWLIKSIEKSIQGMERILKSFREMIKLKIFKKWLNCCKLCKIVSGKYSFSVCLWPHVVYFFINSLHYVWSWSAVPVWRCGCGCYCWLKKLWQNKVKLLLAFEKPLLCCNSIWHLSESFWPFNNFKSITPSLNILF